MPFQQRKSARRYRPRLLLLVLGAMLLVSALPLGLYHFQVLAQPGKAHRYRERPANRAYAFGGRRDSAFRRQSLSAAHQRTPNSGPYGAPRSGERPGARAA